MRRETILLAALPLAFAAVSASAAQKAKLPCVVYSDAGANAPYIPSGYMGDTGALHVNDNYTVHPHSGKSCMQVAFTGHDWAGVVWQSPANDWGDKPGGFNLTGAKKLTFWARGAKGGEKVDFKFGLLGKDKKFHDTATGEAKATLTKAWKQYTINVAGKNLSQIKTGFVFVVSGAPTTFYLDDVRYQ